MVKSEARCLSCNELFEYYTSNSTGKYCSPQCHSDHQYTEYIRLWKEGKRSGNKNGGHVSNHVRRYLHETYNDSCEKCGWNEVNKWTEKVPLQVSHKDGDWKNTTPDNVELVCPNCHSLTEFHGARNKGRGRYALTGTPHPSKL